MKRFAIALTALAAACAVSSVMAQASISDQLRALRERRAGGGGGGAPAAATGSPAPNQPQAVGQTQEDPEMVALAKSKNCLSCHGIDAKVIGPSFRDVAAKYEVSSDDVVRLMDSIRNGSQGTWGVSLTMPANKRVNELEAKRLAAWILHMK